MLDADTISAARSFMRDITGIKCPQADSTENYFNTIQ